MSLAVRIIALSTRIGQEIKSLRSVVNGKLDSGAAAVDSGLLSSNTSINNSNKLQYWNSSGDAVNNPDAGWNYGIKMGHGDADTYYGAQLAFNFFQDAVSFRRRVGGTLQNWVTFWHSGNFDPSTKAAANHGDHGLAAHESNSQAHPRDTRNQVAGSYETAFGKNSAFNKNFGINTGEVCQGNDSRLSDARTPTDTSVAYAKVAAALKQRNTVTSSIDLSANGIGIMTLSANTAFTFTNFELNKSYLLIITANGFTPSWSVGAKHIPVTGNEAFGTTGVFYVNLACIDATAGSEKLLTTVMKGA